ncbi:hypothetical protein OSB04_021360 [Centaurea solstitialis]|uniref:Fe2OG dioxygenase domain-containing protein n=1 Tax=Centaurea solstitialis TaxID=347529 RepID=A0AA38TCF4_9ASTR|nr:hypothetical protein OSB04_021360 [Centaurea solstitialis]
MSGPQQMTRRDSWEGNELKEGTTLKAADKACMECGFFYVINHGISEEFMDQVFGESKKLFHLPLDQKMKLLRNEKKRGYTPLLDELLDPVNQLCGDHKEGYYIGVEVPEDDPEAERTFYGPNLWPDSDILPGWRQTMEKYRQEALEVVRKIARLIALALDLDFDFFERPEMLGKPIVILRLLRYAGQVSDPAKGLFGAGAHSDYGLLTLLATDSVSGLQICKDKDARPRVWENVEPIKGFLNHLVALYAPFQGLRCQSWRYVGAMEQRSTLHRVLSNGQERYSIPYFVLPSHDCVVECLPSCQSKENPPKFPPVKCESYLLGRYQDTHADLSTYKEH